MSGTAQTNTERRHAPPAALLIAGPTASGKSAIALAVAKELKGMIINTDSMQVYRDVPILTAQPDAAARAQAPHRLYGVLDAGEVCSAGRWLALAAEALAEARKCGMLPIFVGGTGLYFRALTEGLAPVSAIPEPVRRQARALYEELGGERFRARLAVRDPESAARLPPGDRQRLIRAWEVVTATGRPLAEWQAQNAAPLLSGPDLRLALMPDRDWLYGRCEARFDAMLAAGAVDEVKALQARGLPPDRPVMKALGVPQLGAFLAGECSLEAAVAAAKTATRRYAKRQMTWIKTQMISWNIISAQDSERLTEKIFTIIRENALTLR